MWWLVIVSLICGLVGIYIALRLYINTILTKEAKFSLIINKLQKEAESIVIEFNRITDRNVTIVEESAIKLNKLIEQSRKYLTRLSKKNTHEDQLPASYSPQTIRKRSVVHHVQPQSIPDDTIRTQIVQLLQENINPEEIAIRVEVSVSEVEAISLMLNK